MPRQVWRTDDVEYGSLGWLRREILVKQGMTPDHRLIGRTERASTDSIIESGLHLFCQAGFPASPSIPSPPDEEGRQPDSQHIEHLKEIKRRPPHRWSFLTQIHDIPVKSGTHTYEMPEDFGAEFDEPTAPRKGGRIAIVREAHIRQLLVSDPQSGKPKYVALRRSSVGGAQKQKSELIFYPTPDADETIQVEYRVNPARLSDSSQYPPGGIEHAETLLAYCCYALAQRTGQGLNEAIQGVQDRLVASIVLDRASAKPTSEGVWVDDDNSFNAAYLSRMIGRHIGAGPNPNAWTHQQQQLIAEILRRTRRRIYNPPLLPGEPYGHSWTFLRVLEEFVTRPGQWVYDFPRDFTQVYGDMSHSTAGATLYPRIRMVPESSLRQMLQREVTTARPDRFAIRIKDHDDAQGTRYECLLWPVPDGHYSIQYRYKVNPDAHGLSSLPDLMEKLDLHGGDQYSEMYLECAMLIADEMNDIRNSAHYDRFMRALQQAVSTDRVNNAPESNGYNGDPSSREDLWSRDPHDYDANIVNYPPYTDF